MALWVVRIEKRGRFEQRFLDTRRVYWTWDALPRDLHRFSSKWSVAEALHAAYPDLPSTHIDARARQTVTFVQRMRVGDWVIVPSKEQPTVHVAEITGDYEYHESAGAPYFHSRPVTWLATDIPKSHFPTEIQSSIGSKRALFNVKKNDAERRVREMAKAGWRAAGVTAVASASGLQKGIRLRRLVLENIRSFEHAEIDLAPRGRPVPWTVLLGDNGTGKSTILRCIALALAADQEVYQLTGLAARTGAGGKGEWLRHGTDSGRIALEVEDRGRLMTSELKIRRTSRGELFDMRRRVTASSGTAGNPTPFVCGYGAGRRAFESRSFAGYSLANAAATESP